VIAVKLQGALEITYTAAGVDDITVGGDDLIEVLQRYAGRQVTIQVADHPIDLFDREEAPR